MKIMAIMRTIDIVIFAQIQMSLNKIKLSFHSISYNLSYKFFAESNEIGLHTDATFSNGLTEFNRPVNW